MLYRVDVENRSGLNILVYLDGKRYDLRMGNNASYTNSKPFSTIDIDVPSTPKYENIIFEDKLSSSREYQGLYEVYQGQVARRG